jgi:UDP-N-acetylmuramoyl-tripeptide--D-alanyl-D-alanine ligase
MQLERAESSGALILNDAYNANPTSMRAALEALAAIDADRRIAIVGRMAELAEPRAQHAEIARLAGDLGIELIAVGTDLYGVTPVDDPIAALGSIGGRDAVLVKGSRVAGLERVAERVRTER